ncbi:MAG: hypothetical protein C0467_03220 [Planctomycetaceae bacterium]|nr:hypothetical protein [Planctomycetaceae bacterium]
MAFLLTAVVIGCGPGKELPDAVVRPKEVSSSAADPNGPAPAASEPAAKAVIDRALGAISGNDPTRLSKAKVAKVTYQGAVKTSPQNTDMTKASRVIETVWPSLALVADDFMGDFPNTAFYLRESQGWMRFGPKLNPETLPQVLGPVIRNDLGAWHWMMLGLPLSDPKAIVFGVAKKPGGTSVKVALPDRPVYLVTFDETSGLPVKSEYHPLENQLRVRKVFVMTEHKPVAGLLLPTKIEFTQNDLVAERWSSPNWEFPESIDPARFEQPKQ